MSELAASLRSLPFERRRDIVVEPVFLRGKRQWHLKDPLVSRYWQFGDEEFFLWQQLERPISYTEWQRRFQSHFKPRRIELRRLREFLGMLHREGLVLCDAPGQAETMLARRVENESASRLRRLVNILAIRFRGIDPDRALNATYPAIRWLFHPATIFFHFVLILSAVVLILAQWSQVSNRLPSADLFLTASNIVWLAAALAVAKVLHELGHAFTMKHFGGECHELGLMLLVFTPCLYCNVSDTWLVPSKWRRIAVSSAGILVELVLAAGATWIWWLSTPGLLNSICLNIMVVCSIGTVFLNANPLLRYDGYFILSDFLEIPNLGSESARKLRELVLRVVVGGPEGGDGGLSSLWLAAYALLSFGYRVVMLGLIAWFFYHWLREYRVEFVFYVAGAIVLAALMTSAAKSSARLFRNREIKGLRAGWGIIATLILVGGLVALPFPRHVWAPAVIEPTDAMSVYVSTPGVLVGRVRPGQRVEKGEELATLTNRDLEHVLVKLTAERDRLRTDCEVLRRQLIAGGRSAGVARIQLPTAEKSLAETERQLQQRNVEREKLVLRAPCDGVVLAPRPRQPSGARIDELPGWSGSPFDSSNAGCFLEAGVEHCRISAGGASEAKLLLDDHSVGRIAIGQTAVIQLDELPLESTPGAVAAMSSVKVEDVPVELTAKNRLAASGGEQGPTPSEFYQATVRLSGQLPVPYGAAGWCRLRIGSEPLYRRAYESLCRTFNL